MSGTVGDRKRLLEVTEESLGRACLSVGHHRDFLRGSGVRGTRGVRECLLYIDPLQREVKGRVVEEPGSRNLWLSLGTETQSREFFSFLTLAPGDVVGIERTAHRRFRVYAAEVKSERNFSWQSLVRSEPPGRGPTVLELFAGCGGMALGFKQAGFRTHLCNEWDAAACDTLRANITDRVAQCSIHDIERFPRVDVVAGGPPCQGFSNLGERIPNDPRNKLLREYVRAVLSAKPRVFVLENVPPLLKSQEYQDLLSAMSEAGYKVDGRVLNAADYGVPQTRKRAIVIGVRGGAPSFPEPTHVNPAKAGLADAHLAPWVTVKDAIGDLPAKPSERNWHIGRNPTQLSHERYRCIPPGGNRWDLPTRLMPDCWKKKLEGGTDLFGRLWWDRPSVTIRCEFFKPEKGRYLHPTAHRPITHREAARLQGFGDDFDFKGTRIEAAMQIGNAVPPPLARVIAEHVRKTYLAEVGVRKRPRLRAAAEGRA